MRQKKKTSAVDDDDADHGDERRQNTLACRLKKENFARHDQCERKKKRRNKNLPVPQVQAKKKVTKNTNNQVHLPYHSLIV